MAYAKIVDGVVVDALEATPQYASSKGWVFLPPGFGIGSAYDGKTFTNPPRWASLEDAKEALRRAVDSRRIVEERKGVRYTFPDGKVDVIQTRNDTDERNRQAQVNAALGLKMKGVEGKVMVWRGESDEIHPMTPDEMIDMGIAVVQMGQATYQAAWQKKEEIEALQSVTEAENYDINTGWPQ